MAIFSPPHPGAVLLETVLREDGGIAVTEFATILKVSRVELSRVVNERAGVSPELAVRLGMALYMPADGWLKMQLAYDLWQAQKKTRPKVQ